MNSWPTKKLGEVADIRIGGTPSRNNPQYWGGNNAWGSISELNGQTIYDTKEHITNLGVSNSNVKPIPAGTTVMSFKLSIGKVATAGTELYTNEAIAGLIPKNNNEVENKWLYYSLPTINYDRYISGAAKGKTLNKAILQEVELPIPPITDQKKIVERLDAIRKAQELCDTQISKTKELFDSLLYKTFESKLEKTDKLGNVVEVVGGGTPSRENKEFFVGSIPWVTIKDMKSIEQYDTIEHVSEGAISKSATHKVPSETVLVATRVGLGKIAISKRELCFNQDIKGLLTKPDLIPYFLLYFLLSKSKYIETSGKGATVKGIDQNFLKNFDVPILPKAEQLQIIGKLNSIQEYIKLLLKQKSLLKELFDSVLYKSMNGEMDN